MQRAVVSGERCIRCHGCLARDRWWCMDSGDRGMDEYCINCGWRRMVWALEVYSPLRDIPARWKHETPT